MPISWLRSLTLAGLVALGAFALLAGRPPRHVLVLLVDTLRADHLGVYGYSRPTSPHLDRHAADGIVFERARSQAACTFPSVNSLLTSRSPGHFLGQGWANFLIPDRFATAGELLGRRGFRTFAASASGVVRATPSNVNPRGGFGRGFETFDETCFNRPASCLNTRFLDFLDRERPDRFFAYLHYMDPHHNYAPPPTFRRRFARRRTGPAWVLAGNPDPIEKALAAGDPPPVTEEDLRTLVDLYDDEIAYWDTEFQQLFAELERRGLRDDTLVVLAADHGEMFLEHGDIKHCRQLWDSVTHVPLVLWVPGRPGRRIAEPVQNLDILPTILDYLRVGTNDWQAEGSSLRPLIEGEHRRRAAFSAQGSLRSINDERWKLIRDVQSGTVRMFDLLADPGERTDLAPTRPAAEAGLESALDAWIAVSDRANTTTHGRASRDVEDALRALGYLQ